MAESRAHRLPRRACGNTGPNYKRNCDGYDEYKLFGFLIHACISELRRKELWPYVTRSNRWPHNSAAFYLDVVEV